MKLIKAILRPDKVGPVKDALVYRGTEYTSSLLPKMHIEVIVESARTGEAGDGRIFVLPSSESYRIRTGEKDVL